MAPFKAVKSLYSLSQQVIISSLKSVFKKLDNNDRQQITELKTHFEGLPVIIVDNLAADLLDIPIIEVGSENVEDMKIILTLQIFTSERTERLELRHRYCRLSNTMLQPIIENAAMKSIIRAENLRKLSIRSVKCTDGILKILGLNCQRLVELEFEEGSYMTDEGLHWIIPNCETEVHGVCKSYWCFGQQHGCPEMISLAITKESDYISHGDDEKMKVYLLKYFKCLKKYSCQVDGKFDLNIQPNFVSSVAKLDFLNTEEVPMIIDLQLLPSFFPHLLSICVPIKYGQLKEFIICPNLIELELLIEDTDDVYTETDVEIEYLLENHPNAKNFEKLSFGHFKTLNTSEFLAIAARCPNITNLSVNVAEFLDVQKLTMRQVYFTQLKDVHVVFPDLGNAWSLEYEKILGVLSFVLQPALGITRIELEFFFGWDDSGAVFPLGKGSIKKKVQKVGHLAN